MYEVKFLYPPQVKSLSDIFKANKSYPTDDVENWKPIKIVSSAPMQLQPQQQQPSEPRDN
ncbi:unnamed protein product [Ceratitis capitata]|uniref:(Mediterranean fruit fly) hypothetical protein n=1 Tax=Ceratitis capitata TaxID=7213 RepID=A0A811U3E6_CERCA|nr:unnamed protein product [Ceratitis capitata]